MIGKTYELLNPDGTILHSFKITGLKKERTEPQKHSDGSESPSFYSTCVANGSGWYRVCGGKHDRIVD